MKLHQCACAAPPWISTRPGNDGSPHESALIDAPSTSTRLTVGRVASALENHDGTPALLGGVLMQSRSSQLCARQTKCSSSGAKPLKPTELYVVVYAPAERMSTMSPSASAS